MISKQYMLFFCFLLFSVGTTKLSKTRKCLRKNKCPRAARCPREVRYYRYGKCYSKSQLIKRKEDAKCTLPICHAFSVSGTVEKGDVVTGVHFSALRLHPHIYHAIAEFQFKDPLCADIVRRNYSSIKEHAFLIIQYNQTTIKLVDLLRGRKSKGFVANIGYAPKTPLVATAISKCELRVKRIIDIRRYSPKDTFPIFAQYLMFATREKKIFLSHIPTNCKDYQQILSININITSNIYRRNLRRGVVIIVPSIPGHIIPVKGKIPNPITESPRKLAAIHTDTRMCGATFYFTLDSIVFHDTNIINLGCPSAF